MLRVELVRHAVEDRGGGRRNYSAIVNGGVHRVHQRRFCNEEDKGALGDDE